MPDISQKTPVNTPDNVSKPNNHSTSMHALNISEETHISYRDDLLPDADMMRSYEEILPGATKRIFDIIEKEQAHKINFENELLKNNFKYLSKGQNYAFIISLLGFSLATLLAFYDNDTVAGILVGTTLVTIVAVFLQKNQKNDKNETENK